MKTFRTIGSPGYPMDEEWMRKLAGVSYDRSHSRAGIARQLHAITASGDRTAALHKLRLPATVIHGTSDPLIRPVAGRATARAIPGSHLRMIDGMGHDLPEELWPTFVEEIATTQPAPASPCASGNRPERTQRFGPTNSSSFATSALRET